MEMLTIGLAILIGGSLVLLGRWVYVNPRRLLPRWGLLNREHPAVQKVAKLYATFLIFFGLLAATGVSFGLLLRNVPGMPLLVLALAVGGAWLLRPKISPEPPVAAPSNQPTEQRLLSRHWKRYLAIFAALMVSVMVLIFIVIGNSEPSKMAFAMAAANPVVRQRLGEPIKRGFFTTGNIETSGPAGHADVAIPISGPKGKATIYAVARKVPALEV